MLESKGHSPTVSVQRLQHAADLPLPAYATVQSAGLDLMAAVASDVTLAPGARQLIPTGLAIALPAGFEAQVRPRSGLALKHGITVLNSPGTIDADYRGEVQVLLINHGQTPFVIKRGDRIAQMVVAPVTQIAWSIVEQLDQTERGSGGYGSTGIAAVAQ
ncbi:MAG TPA: dUTP diphosphatase [Dongiaceae bacterium]|nr:dUTP diphosphatase [Dongiaceae bacterium]